MPKRSVKRNRNTGSKKVESKVVVTQAIKVREEKDSSRFGDGSQNATGINWIDLPEEILVMIFGFLSQYDLVNAREVCSQWRRVAVSKWLLPLWRQVDVVFSFEDPFIKNSVEYKLLRAAPVLDSLCFGGMSLNQFTEVASKIVERNKRKDVRRLSFRDCFARVDDLLKVLQCYGSHVVDLSSSGLRIQWTNDREKPIFSHLPNLQIVKFLLDSAEDNSEDHPEDYNSTTPWPQKHNLLFFPRRLNNLYHFKDQLRKLVVENLTVFPLSYWEKFILKMPKSKFLSVVFECEKFQCSRNGNRIIFKFDS